MHSLIYKLCADLLINLKWLIAQWTAKQPCRKCLSSLNCWSNYSTDAMTLYISWFFHREHGLLSPEVNFFSLVNKINVITVMAATLMHCSIVPRPVRKDGPGNKPIRCRAKLWWEPNMQQIVVYWISDLQGNVCFLFILYMYVMVFSWVRVRQ